MKEIWQKIVATPRYQANLDWGHVRPGHPEGTVRAHIAELEKNLENLKSKISEEYYWKLKVLIHTHDICKAEAQDDVPIVHSKSHASLASQFLLEFCQDTDLANMLQYHDEGYALWLHYKQTGTLHKTRWELLLRNIHDWNLFLLFSIIDGCTEGKGREPLRWFITEVNRNKKTPITVDWIL